MAHVWKRAAAWTLVCLLALGGTLAATAQAAHAAEEPAEEGAEAAPEGEDTRWEPFRSRMSKAVPETREPRAGRRGRGAERGPASMMERHTAREETRYRHQQLAETIASLAERPVDEVLELRAEKRFWWAVAEHLELSWEQVMEACPR